MRTPQEILIDYMFYKIGTLYKITKDPICFEFLTPNDIIELKKWDTDTSERIIGELFYSLQGWDDVYDIDINPWCLYQKLSGTPDCHLCGFNKRHGYCHAEGGSLYANFFNKYGSINKVLRKVSEFMENAREILNPNRFRDPRRLILNLTLNPSFDKDVLNLKDNELESLKQALTFKQAPSFQEIINRAECITNLVSNLDIDEDAEIYAAIIDGPPYLMSSLERALLDNDIIPIYKFSNEEFVSIYDTILR